MAAIRMEGPFANTDQHLIAEGEAPMSALGAIRRKLLVVCRGVLINDEDYNPERGSVHAHRDQLSN